MVRLELSVFRHNLRDSLFETPTSKFSHSKPVNGKKLIKCKFVLIAIHMQQNGLVVWILGRSEIKFSRIHRKQSAGLSVWFPPQWNPKPTIIGRVTFLEDSVRINEGFLFGRKINLQNDRIIFRSVSGQSRSKLFINCKPSVILDQYAAQFHCKFFSTGIVWRVLNIALSLPLTSKNKFGHFDLFGRWRIAFVRSLHFK